MQVCTVLTQQPGSEAGAGQELEVGRTRPRQYEVWGYGLLMVTLIRWELVLQTIHRFHNH